MDRRKLIIIGLILLLPASLYAWGIIGRTGHRTATEGDYLHDVPCTDNAADTVVTNNGTAANWVSSVNTNTIGNGETFLLDANNDKIYSGENFTINKFEITWVTQWGLTAASSRWMIFNTTDGALSLVDNSFVITVESGTDEFRFEAQGNGGTDEYKETTDHDIADTSTWYTYVLTVDATVNPWTVTLTQDGTALTWGAWTGNPGAMTTGPNALTFGNGTSEPECYIRDITVEDQT